MGAPSSSASVGSATLTMLPSSVDMKVPTETAEKTSQGERSSGGPEDIGETLRGPGQRRTDRALRDPRVRHGGVRRAQRLAQPRQREVVGDARDDDEPSA